MLIKECIVATNGLSLNHATPLEETVERTNELTQYNERASTVCFAVQ